LKGLIQRVNSASVTVDGEVVGSIEGGILLLLGVEKEDDQARADKLLHKVINYRIFADDNGRMNRSLLDVGGALLVVSQFTLVADTSKGMRAGFSAGASPELGAELYHYFVAQAGSRVARVQSGRFGADMQVSLVNDGPVTFWLQ